LSKSRRLLVSGPAEPISHLEREEVEGVNVFLLTDEEYMALIRALDPSLWEDEAGLRAKLRYQHNAQKDVNLHEVLDKYLVETLEMPEEDEA
jgi:hypothetical protein